MTTARARRTDTRLSSGPGPAGDGRPKSLVISAPRHKTRHRSKLLSEPFWNATPYRCTRLPIKTLPRQTQARFTTSYVRTAVSSSVERTKCPPNSASPLHPHLNSLKDYRTCGLSVRSRRFPQVHTASKIRDVIQPPPAHTHKSSYCCTQPHTSPCKKTAFYRIQILYTLTRQKSTPWTTRGRPRRSATPPSGGPPAARPSPAPPGSTRSRCRLLVA